MPQYKLTKALPKKMVGNLILSSVTNVKPGDTVTGQITGATAKVLEIRSEQPSTKVVRVDQITNIFAHNETIHSSPGGATTPTVTWFDISLTNQGIVRTIKSGAGLTRVRDEVLTAIRDLSTIITDLAGATFTAAVSYSGTDLMVTNDTLTVTVTPSENVSVAAGSYVAVTLGSNTRHAVYNASLSTPISLVFQYKIVAGDSAVAGYVAIVGTIVGTVKIISPSTGSLQLVPKTVVSPTFSAPNTSLATAN